MGAWKGTGRRALASDAGTFFIATIAFVGLVCLDGAIPTLRPGVGGVPARAALHGAPDDAHGVAPKAHVSLPRVVTLHFQSTWDVSTVTHNCAQATRAGASMVVYTQNVSSVYCNTGLCRCAALVPIKCKPPNRTAGAVNHCEKLAFLAGIIPELKEVIYLDPDVVVMTPDFFHMLAVRGTAHDFLASYAHEAYGARPKYYNFFNSGVLFVRHVRAANYSDLLPRMYKYETGYDQSILTGWVFDTYVNWDVLSWKWHCRGLLRFGQDTPPAACLTIHDRSEAPTLLATLNYSLLTAPYHASDLRD